MLRLTFRAAVIYWRGPAPYFYAPVPHDLAPDIRAAAKLVSYGWGMIPVTARLNGVEFTTALFPKNETYLLPLKDAVRKRTGVTADDEVEVELKIGNPKD